MTKSVAIVTGASQGIGQATAVRLVRDFSTVVLVARNLEHLNRTAEQVESGGAEPLVLNLDLSKQAAADTVVARTLEQFGKIDALLNIAGAVPQIDLFEMTDEQWDAGMALKLHGARRLTVRAWNALKAAKGAVVFISGNSAQFPKAPYAAVGTIDAAIVAVAKAFADRGLRDGVQVNSVLPGPVMTGRRRSYLEHCARAQCQRRGRERGVSERCRNKPIRRARIDRRLNGLPRLPWRAVDDRFSASYRWWRGNIHLTRALAFNANSNAEAEHER